MVVKFTVHSPFFLSPTNLRLGFLLQNLENYFELKETFNS